jgi:hypothetical protein
MLHQILTRPTFNFGAPAPGTPGRLSADAEEQDRADL